MTCKCGHLYKDHKFETGKVSQLPYVECTEIHGLNFCECEENVPTADAADWILYERDYPFLPWKKVSRGTRKSQEQSGEERRAYGRIGRVTGLNPVPAEFCVVRKDSPERIAVQQENEFLNGPTGWTIKDVWMRDNRNPLACLEFKMDTIILQLNQVTILLNEEMLKGKVGSRKSSGLLMQLDAGTTQLRSLALAYQDINWKHGGKIPDRFYHLL